MVVVVVVISPCASGGFVKQVCFVKHLFLANGLTFSSKEKIKLIFTMPPISVR